MKHILSLFLLTLFLKSSISKADDYVWGEEFKEGDIISAATFNQIFNTLQKLNRTPVDADLVGTWSCDAIGLANGANNSGWTVKGFLSQLSNSQVTFTASELNKSVDGSYSYSTSYPNPFYRAGGSYSNNAESGSPLKSIPILSISSSKNKGFLTPDLDSF